MSIPLWLQISLQILLQLVLIALNAVFACAEIAVIETKGTKLDKLAEDGNKRARKLRRMTENPAKFLATIQVAITLAGFLGSAFAAENFSVYIVSALSGKTPLSDDILNTISVILITIVLSYFTLVFGELLPKRLAMKNSERIALSLTPTIGFVAFFAKPLVWLLTVSTNGALRLCGINPHEAEEEVSEEDIRMMADAGSEKGIIDAEENEMIQNVFNFDDITAAEIVTHRTELTVLWEEDSIEVWDEIIRTSVHAHYPVCGKDLDDITGILNADVYLRLKDQSRKSVEEKAITKPYFVADVMKTNTLFRKMKEDRIGIAVVVDEYGGTYGIVTMTDLIEEIVGDLEEDETEQEIVPKDEGFIIAGHTERESLHSRLDVETEGDATTVGGWVMEKLEKIPEIGDEFEAEGLRIRVTKADDKRVLEVYAERIAKDEEDDREKDQD